MKELQEFSKDEKVLITGHTGFKGGWLTQVLLNWGAKVSGIALEPNTDPSLFELLGIEKKISNHFTDIRDFKKVKEIFVKEKPEIVFHLAAQPLVRDSYDDPLYTFETNILGTANVLQTIKEVGGVKSAVIITTDKVYAEEDKASGYREDDKLGGYDPYSSSKAAAEIVIDSYVKSFFNLEKYNQHKTLIASARSGNLVGGGDWSKDRIVPDIVKAVFEKNEKVIIRNPDSVRPWQHVLEPTYGYLLLAKELYEGNKEISGAWNFGPENDSSLTVKELLERILKVLGKGSYIIKRDEEKRESEVLRLNIDKAKKALGWEPSLDINTALKLTTDWYHDFYNGKNIIDITNQQIESFFNKKT